VLELEEDKQDLVTPIMNLMNEGKYEEARAKVNEIPTTWRIAVIWTVAAKTGIVL
jgi:hypothetical protein